MFIPKVYSRLFSSLLSLQTRCYFCRQETPSPTLSTSIPVQYTGSGHICAGCLSDLPWLQHSCYQCAEPLPPALTSSGVTLCGRCLKRPPGFHRTLCPLKYTFPVNRLVSHFKDHADTQVLQLASFLFCSRWQHVISQQPPEYLIAVPLHRKRLYSRGYNQSLELARLLSQQLDIPLATAAVTRTLATGDQKALDAKTRRRNLQKAFRVDPDLAARHVAIIDDVMTTGSTVDAIAKLLQQSGVRQVDIWAWHEHL